MPYRYLQTGVLSLINVLLTVSVTLAEESSIKIGLVSPLTGPVASLAPSEGTILAVEEINARGGINGKKIELIIEDGKCEGRAAASAAQKLIHIDKVAFILGGQCSVETLAIAPIAERAKVLAIASMSTSPDISHAGQFIFRTSPNSLKQGQVLAEYAFKKANYRTVAVFVEESPYAAPIANGFSATLKSLGGGILVTHEFNTGTADFRSLIAAVSTSRPDAVVVIAQSIPLAAQIVRQMRELGINVPILGTETTGNVPSAWPEYAPLFEGMVFSQANFALTEPNALAMIERYGKRFGRIGLKYPYQAEAYDAAGLLAEAIERCGEESEKVRECLQTSEGYEGVTGEIRFDENGDAVWQYGIRKIAQSAVVNVDGPVR